MARLKAKTRNELPDSDFAGPGRSYPVEDKKHARIALGLVGMHGTSALKARIRAKVHRKFPDIGKM